MEPLDLIGEEPAREPNPWFASETMPRVPAVPPSKLKKAAAYVQAHVSVRDSLVVVGLVLLGHGLYLVSPAAGWGVPGLVLLWYALPQRPRFLEPTGPKIVNITQPVEVPRWQQGQGAPHGRA